MSSETDGENEGEREVISQRARLGYGYSVHMSYRGGSIECHWEPDTPAAAGASKEVSRHLRERYVAARREFAQAIADHEQIGLSLFDDDTLEMTVFHPGRPPESYTYKDGDFVPKEDDDTSEPEFNLDERGKRVIAEMHLKAESEGRRPTEKETVEAAHTVMVYEMLRLGTLTMKALRKQFGGATDKATVEKAGKAIAVLSEPVRLVSTEDGTPAITVPPELDEAMAHLRENSDAETKG